MTRETPQRGRGMDGLIEAVRRSTLRHPFHCRECQRAISATERELRFLQDAAYDLIFLCRGMNGPIPRVVTERLRRALALVPEPPPHHERYPSG